MVRTVAVVHSVVELHGLIPVVDRRESIEAVVARRFCRKFDVCVSPLAQVKIGSEELMGYVVEVVVAVKEAVLIVAFAEVRHVGRTGIRHILARHVVGDKINYHLHSGVMRTLYQRLEFLHALLDIDGYVRINVVIILYGIRRSGFAFDHMRIVAVYAVLAVVRLV